eukprot:TRINITY_DN19869_c0_g1_i1.p1 TRINITY_DN19869_c0_g1~~TRINITY_DN19869_c0_g1_i1.p1  ORF type:complete len:3935 (+),score=978.61 TRINITY_DN19869_c0_g1_i1:1728-11807(+)
MPLKTLGHVVSKHPQQWMSALHNLDESSAVRINLGVEQLLRKTLREHAAGRLPDAPLQRIRRIADLAGRATQHATRDGDRAPESDSRIGELKVQTSECALRNFALWHNADVVDYEEGQWTAAPVPRIRLPSVQRPSQEWLEIAKVVADCRQFVSSSLDRTQAQGTAVRRNAQLESLAYVTRVFTSVIHVPSSAPTLEDKFGTSSEQQQKMLKDMRDIMAMFVMMWDDLRDMMSDVAESRYILTGCCIVAVFDAAARYRNGLEVSKVLASGSGFRLDPLSYNGESIGAVLSSLTVIKPADVMVLRSLRKYFATISDRKAMLRMAVEGDCALLSDAGTLEFVRAAAAQLSVEVPTDDDSTAQLLNLRTGSVLHKAESVCVYCEMGVLLKVLLGCSLSFQARGDWHVTGCRVVPADEVGWPVSGTEGALWHAALPVLDWSITGSRAQFTLAGMRVKWDVQRSGRRGRAQDAHAYLASLESAESRRVAIPLALSWFDDNERFRMLQDRRNRLTLQRLLFRAGPAPSERESDADVVSQSVAAEAAEAPIGMLADLLRTTPELVVKPLTSIAEQVFDSMGVGGPYSPGAGAVADFAELCHAVVGYGRMSGDPDCLSDVVGMLERYTERLQTWLQQCTDDLSTAASLHGLLATLKPRSGLALATAAASARSWSSPMDNRAAVKVRKGALTAQLDGQLSSPSESDLRAAASMHGAVVVLKRRSGDLLLPLRDCRSGDVMPLGDICPLHVAELLLTAREQCDGIVALGVDAAKEIAAAVVRAPPADGLWFEVEEGGGEWQYKQEGCDAPGLRVDLYTGIVHADGRPVCLVPESVEEMAKDTPQRGWQMQCVQWAANTKSFTVHVLGTEHFLTVWAAPDAENQGVDCPAMTMPHQVECGIPEGRPKKVCDRLTFVSDMLAGAPLPVAMVGASPQTFQEVRRKSSVVMLLFTASWAPLDIEDTLCSSYKQRVRSPSVVALEVVQVPLEQHPGAYQEALQNASWPFIPMPGCHMLAEYYGVDSPTALYFDSATGELISRVETAFKLLCGDGKNMQSATDAVELVREYRGADDLNAKVRTRDVFFDSTRWCRPIDPCGNKPADFVSEIWIMDLLRRVCSAEAVQPEVRFLLPVEVYPEDATEAKVLMCDGVASDDLTWKEVVLTRAPESVVVSSIETFGRRAWRVISYASDGRLSWAPDLPHSARSKEFPYAVGNLNERRTVCKQVVVTRRNGGLGGLETMVPLRLLQALIPASLLVPGTEAWLGQDGVLRLSYDGIAAEVTLSSEEPCLVRLGASGHSSMGKRSAGYFVSALSHSWDDVLLAAAAGSIQSREESCWAAHRSRWPELSAAAIRRALCTGKEPEARSVQRGGGLRTAVQEGVSEEAARVRLVPLGKAAPGTPIGNLSAVLARVAYPAACLAWGVDEEDGVRVTAVHARELQLVPSEAGLLLKDNEDADWLPSGCVVDEDPVAVQGFAEDGLPLKTPDGTKILLVAKRTFADGMLRRPRGLLTTWISYTVRPCGELVQGVCYEDEQYRAMVLGLQGQYAEAIRLLNSGHVEDFTKYVFHKHACDSSPDGVCLRLHMLLCDRDNASEMAGLYDEYIGVRSFASADCRLPARLEAAVESRIKDVSDLTPRVLAKLRKQSAVRCTGVSWSESLSSMLKPQGLVGAEEVGSLHVKHSLSLAAKWFKDEGIPVTGVVRSLRDADVVALVRSGMPIRDAECGTDIGLGFLWMYKVLRGQYGVELGRHPRSARTFAELQTRWHVMLHKELKGSASALMRRVLVAVLAHPNAGWPDARALDGTDVSDGVDVSLTDPSGVAADFCRDVLALAARLTSDRGSTKLSAALSSSAAAATKRREDDAAMPAREPLPLLQPLPEDTGCKSRPIELPGDGLADLAKEFTAMREDEAGGAVVPEASGDTSMLGKALHGRLQSAEQSICRTVRGLVGLTADSLGSDCAPAKELLARLVPKLDELAGRERDAARQSVADLERALAVPDADDAAVGRIQLARRTKQTPVTDLTRLLQLYMSTEAEDALARIAPWATPADVLRSVGLVIGHSQRAERAVEAARRARHFAATLAKQDSVRESGGTAESGSQLLSLSDGVAEALDQMEGTDNPVAQVVGFAAGWVVSPTELVLAERMVTSSGSEPECTEHVTTGHSDAVAATLATVLTEGLVVHVCPTEDYCNRWERDLCHALTLPVFGRGRLLSGLGGADAIECAAEAQRVGGCCVTSISNLQDVVLAASQQTLQFVASAAKSDRDALVASSSSIRDCVKKLRLLQDATAVVHDTGLSLDPTRPGATKRSPAASRHLPEGLASRARLGFVLLQAVTAAVQGESLGLDRIEWMAIDREFGLRSQRLAEIGKELHGALQSGLESGALTTLPPVAGGAPRRLRVRCPASRSSIRFLGEPLAKLAVVFLESTPGFGDLKSGMEAEVIKDLMSPEDSGAVRDHVGSDHSRLGPYARLRAAKDWIHHVLPAVLADSFRTSGSELDCPDFNLGQHVRRVVENGLSDGEVLTALNHELRRAKWETGPPELSLTARRLAGWLHEHRGLSPADIYDLMHGRSHRVRRSLRFSPAAMLAHVDSLDHGSWTGPMVGRTEATSALVVGTFALFRTRRLLYSGGVGYVGSGCQSGRAVGDETAESEAASKSLGATLNAFASAPVTDTCSSLEDLRVLLDRHKAVLVDLTGAVADWKEWDEVITRNDIMTGRDVYRHQNGLFLVAVNPCVPLELLQRVVLALGYVGKGQRMVLVPLACKLESGREFMREVCRGHNTVAPEDCIQRSLEARQSVWHELALQTLAHEFAAEDEGGDADVHRLVSRCARLLHDPSAGEEEDAAQPWHHGGRPGKGQGGKGGAQRQQRKVWGVEISETLVRRSEFIVRCIAEFYVGNAADPLSQLRRHAKSRDDKQAAFLEGDAQAAAVSISSCRSRAKEAGVVLFGVSATAPRVSDLTAVAERAEDTRCAGKDAVGSSCDSFSAVDAAERTNTPWKLDVLYAPTAAGLQPPFYSPTLLQLRFAGHCTFPEQFYVSSNWAPQNEVLLSTPQGALLSWSPKKVEGGDEGAWKGVHNRRLAMIAPWEAAALKLRIDRGQVKTDQVALALYDVSGRKFASTDPEYGGATRELLAAARFLAGDLSIVGDGADAGAALQDAGLPPRQQFLTSRVRAACGSPVPWQLYPIAPLLDDSEPMALWQLTLMDHFRREFRRCGCEPSRGGIDVDAIWALLKSKGEQLACLSRAPDTPQHHHHHYHWHHHSFPVMTSAQILAVLSACALQSGSDGLCSPGGIPLQFEHLEVAASVLDSQPCSFGGDGRYHGGTDFRSHFRVPHDGAQYLKAWKEHDSLVAEKDELTAKLLRVQQSIDRMRSTLHE